MNETIGSRICKYRKAKGMTQEALAEAMGVSGQAVSKWENDNSCPDILLLPRLAKVLGVTTDAILSGKEEEVMVLPPEKRKNVDDLIMRIYVNSADGDRVKVNLPLNLMSVCMEIGMEFIPGGTNSDALKNIDFQNLLAMAQQGAVGKLVEVESSDGDIVEIVIE